jgi:hypothetical protein
MKVISPLFAAAVFAAVTLAPRLHAEQTLLGVDRFGAEARQAKPSIVSVKAFDSKLNELKRLRAGSVVRIVASADVARIPNAVDAKLSASAIFTVSVFARPVSYEVELPELNVGADSTLNPAVNTKGFGRQKVGAEWQNKKVVRSFILRLPKETPSGTIAIKANLTATGLQPITQELRFPVVR